MANELLQFHQMFFDEAAEHLASMEQLLLRLDIAQPDPDELNAIFRAAHSIKGGAGTFGFTDLTEVTHVLETLLDRIRKNEIALRASMVDVFLQAGDVLRDQLAAHQGAGPVAAERIAVVVERLQGLTAASGAPGPAPDAESSGSGLFRHTVRYQPTSEVSETSELADSLFAELGKLGDVELAIEPVEGSGVRYVYALTSAAAASEVNEIFDFVAQADEFQVSSARLGEPSRGALDAADCSGDHGFGFFDGAPGAVAQPAVEADDGYGFFAPLAEAAPPSVPEKSPAARPEGRPEAKVGESGGSGDSSIRVSIEKVDQLINLVGELVITQAMLAQTVSGLERVQGERLSNGMAQLERNTRSLQESVMSIRMMPMSFVFGRFPRLVRDLAAKLGKEIELVTEGEATELDKGLIERIVDPLTHLVRNSLDHGIETPEKRRVAGKASQGMLTLRAGHQGGSVVIDVEDNGGGLNRQKILDKAAERGLPASDSMSDQEVWQLIFAPGFSTADAVTDVSGRGVGMDVVKRNIDALGGRVDIASVAGHGTTVSIRLPLTLAILDGMSVGVGREVFIIPLAHIAESLQPLPADIHTVSGGSGQGQLVHVRGEYLPLVPLYRVFNLVPHSEQPALGILVIVETGSGRMAFFVDELLGQHQVVIKSLDANYRKVAGIAGATIMGDGRVALILDVAGVAALAQGRQ